MQRKDEGYASPGVCNGSRPTDFSAYSERSCPKLGVKFTVTCAKVFSFQEKERGFAPRTSHQKGPASSPHHPPLTTSGSAPACKIMYANTKYIISSCTPERIITRISTLCCIPCPVKSPFLTFVFVSIVFHIVTYHSKERKFPQFSRFTTMCTAILHLLS